MDFPLFVQVTHCDSRGEIPVDDGQEDLLIDVHALQDIHGVGMLCQIIMGQLIDT